MKLEIVTHFSIEDTDCGGDYYSIDVVAPDGKAIASYGDYYHDKGREKVEGFLDGLRYAGIKVTTVEKHVPDMEY